MEQFPPRYEFMLLNSESRELTITPWELFLFYVARRKSRIGFLFPINSFPLFITVSSFMPILSQMNL